MLRAARGAERRRRGAVAAASRADGVQPTDVKTQLKYISPCKAPSTYVSVLLTGFALGGEDGRGWKEGGRAVEESGERKEERTG